MKCQHAEGRGKRNTNDADPVDPNADVVAALRARERRFIIAVFGVGGLLFAALKPFP